jgi:hypothetical protein
VRWVAGKGQDSFARKLASAIPGMGLGVFFINKRKQPSSGPTITALQWALARVAWLPFWKSIDLGAGEHHRHLGRTEDERLATILLPNSVARGDIGWHEGGAGGEKATKIQDFSTQNKTRRHGHERISSAVHSTTLPPLQGAKSGASPRVGPCSRA